MRLAGADAVSQRRLSFVQSLLAGPGPVFECTGTALDAHNKPPEVRAFDSVFGALHGEGIASVVAAADATESAARQIDWMGNRCLYAGWKGFFASGLEHTITVPDLAIVRADLERNRSGEPGDSLAVAAPRRPGRDETRGAFTLCAQP